MPRPRARYSLRDTVGDPRDWFFTWQIKDDTTFASDCDFCGQDAIRLSYEVRHDTTQGELWVCSRCVGRYPLGGQVDGAKLEPRAARSHAHELTVRLKQKTCHDIIRQVQSLFPTPAIDEAVVYFDRNLQLSPVHAAELFARLMDLESPVDVRVFDVQTRSISHQHEFGTLDCAHKRLVWPALSPLQRRRLTALGFAPMPTQRRTHGRGAKLSGSRMSALNETAGPDQPIKKAFLSNN